MSIEIKKGERLYLSWDLPFTEHPANTVVLPMVGDELCWYDKKGNIIFSMTRDASSEDGYMLLYYNNRWRLVFDSNEYDFLPYGKSKYELTVIGDDLSPIIQDSGWVTINE